MLIKVIKNHPNQTNFTINATIPKESPQKNFGAQPQPTPNFPRPLIPLPQNSAPQTTRAHIYLQKKEKKKERERAIELAQPAVHSQ